jgi:hypothetical protein
MFAGKSLMPELTADQLRAILQKLDDVCRQARELQAQLRAAMLERARANQPARSSAPSRDRRKRPRAVQR